MSSLQMPIHRPSALSQSRTSLTTEKGPLAIQVLKIIAIRRTIKGDIHNKNPNWADTGHPPTQVQGRLAGPTSEFEDEVYSAPRRPELRQPQRLQSRNKDVPWPEPLTEVISTPLNHRSQPVRRITRSQDKVCS